MPLKTTAPSWRRRRRQRLSMGCRSCIAAQIAGARLVANPGCYATSVILPLKPLVAAGLVDSGARHCCRCQERRERRGQGADGEEHILCMRRTIFRPTACLRIATPASCWSRSASMQARSFLRRTCCRFRAAFCRRSTCTSKKPQTRASVIAGLQEFFCGQPHGAAL